MLTSFFGNSRPINYLVLILLLVGVLVTYSWLTIPKELSSSAIAYSLLQSFGLVFTVLLFDFILRKNTLNQRNTYAVFILVICYLSYPKIMSHSYILWTQLFLLLAMRRIFSLQSPYRTQKKILDAAIWITVASFFYFWSFLFFLVLYVALVKRPQLHYKMLLIPPLGVVAVVLIATATQFLLYDALPWFAIWTLTVDSTLSVYDTITWVLPSGVLIVLLIWAISYRSLRMAKVPKKELPNYQLVHHWAVVALGAVALAGERSGVEMLLIVPPLSIGITTYLERLEERWFRELLLWVLLVLPFTVFFL